MSKYPTPAFNPGDKVRYRSDLTPDTWIWNEAHGTYHHLTKKELDFAIGKTFIITEIKNYGKGDFFYSIRHQGSDYTGHANGNMLIPAMPKLLCHTLI